MTGVETKSVFRSLVLVAGGAAIVAAFFYGTLFVFDYMENNPGNAKDRDALRARHFKTLKTALEAYRIARGAYPAIPDKPAEALKTALVDGGYLRSIPHDPAGPNVEYRYVSEGRTYGMLFHLEVANGAIPAGGTCLIGVGTAGTGWWGQPPNCPF